MSRKVCVSVCMCVCVCMSVCLSVSVCKFVGQGARETVSRTVCDPSKLPLQARKKKPSSIFGGLELLNHGLSTGTLAVPAPIVSCVCVRERAACKLRMSVIMIALSSTMDVGATTNRWV